MKGTLQPSEAKAEKKKLSKNEKQELKTKILQQIVFVKGELKSATFKKDIRAGGVKMRKLERQLKKL